MTDRIEDLIYQSGLTAQGCWDKMDDYDQKAIGLLIQLTIRECAAVVRHVPKQGGGNYGETILKHFNVPIKL
jgi:hypothetical protein